jgi:hypothetical protein
MGLREDAIEFIFRRKRAFQLTFQLEQPANVLVLEDLASFCRASESCAVPGDRDRTMMLEGRREVWLRIQQHLQLTPEQLFALYNGNYPKLRTAQ